MKKNMATRVGSSVLQKKKHINEQIWKKLNDKKNCAFIKKVSRRSQ